MSSKYLDAVKKRLLQNGFIIKEKIQHQMQWFDLVASLTVRERYNVKGHHITLFTNLYFMFGIFDAVDSKLLRRFVKISKLYGLDNLMGPLRLTTHFLFPVAICSNGNRRRMKQIEVKDPMFYPHNTALVPMLVTPQTKTADVRLLSWPANERSSNGAWLVVVDAINLITPK